jgi:ribose transport system substrate-binding protein
VDQARPPEGNVLMLSGPKGNSQGVEENQGLHKILDPTHKYKFIGEQPFEVTNWDPALTQKVLSAAIAKYPKIDVIVSDFGPSLVGALPEFTKSGRKIPALATSDGNVLGCFWKKNFARNPTFKLFTVSTQNDHARLAIDWAVALATGGKKPASTHFPSLVFEDSTTGKPNPVECQPKLPGDIYLSAQLPDAAQAKLVKG